MRKDEQQISYPPKRSWIVPRLRMEPHSCICIGNGMCKLPDIFTVPLRGKLGVPVLCDIQNVHPVRIVAGGIMAPCNRIGQGCKRCLPEVAHEHSGQTKVRLAFLVLDKASILCQLCRDHACFDETQICALCGQRTDDPGLTYVWILRRWLPMVALIEFIWNAPVCAVDLEIQCVQHAMTRSRTRSPGSWCLVSCTLSYSVHTMCIECMSVYTNSAARAWETQPRGIGQIP